MDEVEIKKMIDDYKDHLVSNGDLDERLLFALCREIERETRHLAVKSIYAAATAINERVDLKYEIEKGNY